MESLHGSFLALKHRVLKTVTVCRCHTEAPIEHRKTCRFEFSSNLLRFRVLSVRYPLHTAHFYAQSQFLTRPGPYCYRPDDTANEKETTVSQNAENIVQKHRSVLTDDAMEEVTIEGKIHRFILKIIRRNTITANKRSLHLTLGNMLICPINGSLRYTDACHVIT